jgi:hypothetical protein
MSDSLTLYMNRIQPDAFRAKVDFSPELEEAMAVTLDENACFSRIVDKLNEWVQKHQPCLFARIAAKRSAITYCIIKDSVLQKGDAAVKELIQQRRLRWRQAGFDGESSSFVIAVMSRKLAMAEPNAVLKELALHLCGLYLEESIEPDRIYLDRIYLEQPGKPNKTWEWVAGINYFAANGDKRWWQDHRFPAGIALSVNSVGHMVKSGLLNRALKDLEDSMGTAPGEFVESKVDSLEKALQIAMGTINKASDAPSGKATYLLPLDAPDAPRPSCPIKLPASFEDKDYCSYGGLYHTDVTIPSEYFRADVQRQQDLEPKSYSLDFTYLFDSSLDNPDHVRMGIGRRIKAADTAHPDAHNSSPAFKRLRGVEAEVEINDVPGLRKALDQRNR